MVHCDWNDFSFLFSIMKTRVAIIGAGINGLIAANYLSQSGFDVQLIEKKSRVGGACVSEFAAINGNHYEYALGASVLGLMQRFVFEQTGLSNRIKTHVPMKPKLVFFPDDEKPTKIFRNPEQLDHELSKKWGERGNVSSFRSDESKIIKFLQDGYYKAEVPTIEDAIQYLGNELTDLWIKGDAQSLLDYYFTSERTKTYMAMTVSESGPVSLHEPYSAFTLPLMDSGSIFEGYYGFVKGGIWKITEELDNINKELGSKTILSAEILSVNTSNNRLSYKQNNTDYDIDFDYLLFATDPLSAAEIMLDSDLIRKIEGQKLIGSSGKLNMIFKKPIQWKSGPDSSFRFLFSVQNTKEFEKATLKVLDDDIDYAPGFMQVYCEGAAMRHLQSNEKYDRLAVFLKNISLKNLGDDIPKIENEIKTKVLEYIENAEDCIWTKLLTPKDLKNIFYFPQGNIDHTVLTAGQSYFDRTYSNDPTTNFYQFGGYGNIYMCGAGTYPCGSIAGTPGYMCSQQLIQKTQKY
ncbi:MAG: NAD(P)/FAD-dependent oxidoreductase [Gammaproteobacteria bacterium]|nr:NAD(P)/FAD-dependent oxidoreductase [Gammaproteobacteria bacterium]